MSLARGPRLAACAFALSTLLLPVGASAQSATTGAVAGVVRDSTGAVLSGVTVEASSSALIEKVRVVTTDEQGNYKIVDLRPGTYSITFTLPGFATVKREGIELTAGFTAPANADLRVGALEETVTVTGASPVVDTQNVRSQNLLSRDVLDTVPAAKTMLGFASLTLGATIQAGAGGAPIADVGGSKGDAASALSIHGMRTTDQRLLYDGMSWNTFHSGGGRRIFSLNQVGVQEIVLGTGAASAETETGGVQLNAVPKEGGNAFKFHFSGAYTNGSFQSDRLSDEILSRGVTTVSSVREIYDWGAGLGGRIKRDRLWFYFASRTWGSSEYQPGSYYNKSASALSYEPDLERRGFSDTHSRDVGVRLTWQLAVKHKITLSENVQLSCICYLNVSSTLAPEAAPRLEYGPMHLVQATWNHPASNRLLFEAGTSFGYFLQNNRFEQRFPGSIGVRELSTGFTWGGGQSCCAIARGDGNYSNPLQQRASVSYVTGSHAFKTGMQLLNGFHYQNQDIDQELTYAFLSGRPNTITQWALPYIGKSRLRAVGAYAQDQWTVRQLTLNLGLRFDALDAWVPAQTRAAGRFIPAFSYDRVGNVPKWKDVTPRLGAAYDLFGNGRTAIKGSLGKYVAGTGIELAEANHPSLNIVLSSTRTWTDANGDFTPDCNLSEFGASGECGALANSLFGQPFRNTFYDPDVLEGGGKRGYSWQGALSVQQELGAGIALNAGYFRTWYGNFTATDNELVVPGDFDEYCITAPADVRLPGGGGDRFCGLFDINRSRFGQVRNRVTFASAFGEQMERFDGVDVGVNARLGKGAYVQGGVSVGRQVTDNCFVVDSPQQARDGFCHLSPPWSAGTQYKASGIYPLPWDVETSFTFQNLPGAAIAANLAVPNASIVPSLGRNLSACAATGACTATVQVPLLRPQTEFVDRITQLDLRFTKVLRMQTWRVKGMVDVYNVFNRTTILAVNATYGPAWLRPTAVLGGRLFKFGAQVDF